MADRDRAMLLLYDKGRWVGGRVLSKTSNWVEEEGDLLANSNSSSNIVIETDFVYNGNPLLTAAERFIYVNNNTNSHSAKVQVGYMNDSNTFTYIGSNEGVSSQSVNKQTVYNGIEANGYYINQKTVNLTNRTAAKGRKVCIRLTTYFGVWKIDKVWLSGITRL